MASQTKMGEANLIHTKLLLFLNENIPSGSEIFNDLRIASGAYLTPRDLLQSQSVSDIAGRLINKGKCAIGNYGTLRIMVEQVIQNTEILKEIDKAEKEINAMEGMGNSPPDDDDATTHALAGRSLKSDDQLVDEALSHRIAKKMGGEWQSLLRDLRVDQDTIDQIHDENSKAVDRTFRGLDVWCKREQQNATRGRLMPVLAKYIAFQHLQELFK